MGFLFCLSILFFAQSHSSKTISKILINITFVCVCILLILSLFVHHDTTTPITSPPTYVDLWIVSIGSGGAWSWLVSSRMRSFVLDWNKQQHPSTGVPCRPCCRLYAACSLCCVYGVVINDLLCDSRLMSISYNIMNSISKNRCKNKLEIPHFNAMDGKLWLYMKLISPCKSILSGEIKFVYHYSTI